MDSHRREHRRGAIKKQLVTQSPDILISEIKGGITRSTDAIDYRKRTRPRRRVLSGSILFGVCREDRPGSSPIDSTLQPRQLRIIASAGVPRDWGR